MAGVRASRLLVRVFRGAKLGSFRAWGFSNHTLNRKP